MRSRVRSHAWLLAALLVTAQPAVLRAADRTAEPTGIVRLLRYAACAAATFIATTPQQMGQALIGCGLIYVDEVPSP